jgi:hypothetical protein
MVTVGDVPGSRSKPIAIHPMLRYQSSQNVVMVIAALKKRELALKHQMDLERTAYASWELVKSNPGEAATGVKSLHNKRATGRVALHAIGTFTREMERSRDRQQLKSSLWQPKSVNPARHLHRLASEAETHRSLSDSARTLTPLISDDAHVRSSTKAFRAKSARRSRPSMAMSASEPRLTTREHLLDEAHAPMRELIKLREILRASNSSSSEEPLTQSDMTSSRALVRPQTATANMNRVSERRTPHSAGKRDGPPSSTTTKVAARRGRFRSQGDEESDGVRLPQRYDLAKIRSELSEDLAWLQRAATHSRRP